MVKQQGKRPRRKTPSGNQQLNWLWGRPSVIETLEANRWQVYELFVTAEVQHQYPDLLKAKQKEGVELELVSADRLEELASTKEHQGIVARVSKYPYATMDSLGEQLRLQMATPEIQTSKPLVVLLDRIQDSFTFASILRCCENAGVMGVIVGEHCQSQVTPQIARSSLGAVNHFSIVKAADLVTTAQTVKSLGLRLLTSDVKSTQSVCDTGLNVPTALLIGNESNGLDATLLELCDDRVSFPMLGKVTSLGSTMATGILLYEIRRQQQPAR